MNIRQFIADNVGYRFGGLFDGQGKGDFEFIKPLIPEDFYNRRISDIGCGDGRNTLYIKDLFKASKIVGYERNRFLIKRAVKRGIQVTELDLNKDVPVGEMAVFSRTLHHFDDKEKVLLQASKNFKYIFLFEPKLDLFHALFDGGKPLSEKGWIKLFNKVLVKYKLFTHKNDLIIFYRR